MRGFIQLLVIFGMLFPITISNLMGQIPKELTYQGHLLDGQGAPANGIIRMTFSIYEDVQTQQFIHQETQDVAIEKGYYSISLGLLKPLIASFDKQYFLSVMIDGIESKRIPFTTTPYAIKALGVTNQSVYADDINISGSKNGEAMISDGKSIEWKPVISNVIGDGSVQANTVDGTVYLRITEGAIDGSKIETNSLNHDRFLVPRAPKDKQYLSYDGISKTLVWVDPPSLTLALPYRQVAGFTDTLFSIRNTRNGPAGRFVIETNPGTHHALIGENNGIGAAIAGFAKGNGSAGLFSINNQSGTGSALRVESNARKHGIEVSMTNQTATKTSGIQVAHQSPADSISGIYAMLMASSIGQGASAIRGDVQHSGIQGIGVHGIHSGKGNAVVGSSQAGIGIVGMSTDSIGIIAQHLGTANRHPALYALSASTSDTAYSVHAVLTSQQIGNASSAIYGEVGSDGNRGSGVMGRHKGAGIGVEGHSQQGIGIRGISAFSNGVYGIHTATTGSQAGVFGATTSLDSNASGVLGSIDQLNPGIFSAGIKGLNNSKNANGYGVFGMHAGQGAGVYGTSQSGPAMSAYTSNSSVQGIGVKSLVEGRNAVAVQARTSSMIGLQYGVDAVVAGDSAIAIRGKAPVNAKRTSYAGYFEGNVTVDGGDIMRVYQSSTSSAEKRIAPIAYGSIQTNGASLTGTGNFSCTWDINTKQYFISIHSESYSTAGFITIANAVNPSEPIFITTHQAGADLLAIACYNLQGQKVQTPFHFMIYKP
jgi:hypothetical protein